MKDQVWEITIENSYGPYGNEVKLKQKKFVVASRDLNIIDIGRWYQSNDRILNIELLGDVDTEIRKVVDE